MTVAQTINNSIDRGTDAVAVTAVVSPVWLPLINSVSEVSAVLLPIAGLVWLIIQIIGYIMKYRKDHK